MDVANFLPYSHSGSSLAPSTTRTSLSPSLGLYLLVHPCSTLREQHPPLPPFTSSPVWYTRHGLETASLDTLPPPLTCWLSHPCILCGRGDNSVQHWLNFCPIPALAGSLLLNRPWRTRFWYFTRSHSLGHRSIIAGLWVATRQFVHERSGLPPPSIVPPSVPSANTSTLPRLLAERAYQLIPHFFRSHTAFTPSFAVYLA